MTSKKYAFADLLVELECGHPLLRRFYDQRGPHVRPEHALAMLDNVLNSRIFCHTCAQRQQVISTETVRMGMKRGTPPAEHDTNPPPPTATAAGTK